MTVLRWPWPRHRGARLQAAQAQAAADRAKVENLLRRSRRAGAAARKRTQDNHLTEAITAWLEGP